MAHAHTHITDLSRSTIRRLILSIGLTAAFVVVEVVAGFFANSLALLTDAVHNVTDVLALGLTLWALRAATRPASAGKTYGYHRAGILVAMVNATSLVLISLAIFYDAYRRLIAPPSVKADVLVGVGVAAVVVNLVTALLVRRGSQYDLNLRSVFLHLMGDALSTIGAVVAGVVIHFTGLNWLDPLVSILIGLLIIWNAWGILHESVNILMEATPADIDVDTMIVDIQQVDGVRGVHDLHIWSITHGLRTLSAHILTDDIPISEGTRIQAAISELLNYKYGIAHVTLQLECVDCIPADLYCDITANSHSH
ncbi:MAG TPA: cation diffusion facilitator family transporter [Anaerolineales bacterium]|nr:cation diffusion facilitator family transporter [Anaerolineales bacterium]